MSGSHWARDALFYHVHPLGLCGAPARNEGAGPVVPRLAALHHWLDHWQALGVGALYLGPVFESSSHGYDTVDYYRVDRRLGDDETLAELVAACHAREIRVVLDGVFHHVGRDFWAFRDLRARGEASAHRDWFAGVDFAQRSPLGDPFSYRAWRGHFELVKLELANPAVREHLLGAVRAWIERYAIDGLRLDVAESIRLDFLRELAETCRRARPDFWLLGEVIHGDYTRWTRGGGLDSVTNYELYKGLYSSHDDRNYFELAHSLDRQFGEGGLYRGLPLYTFADNHDVTRIASRLRDPAHLYPLHVLLLTVPGVPSIYYGSEWGLPGEKGGDSDAPLRPALAAPVPPPSGEHPELAHAIARLARVRAASRALRHGDYRSLHVAPEQLAFARRSGEETALVAVNAAHHPATLTLPAPEWNGRTFADLLDPGPDTTVRDGAVHLELPPCWGRVLTDAAPH